MTETSPPSSSAGADDSSLARYLHADSLTLIFARHGQRGAPPIEGFPGRSLTPMGHRQARRLARRVAEVPIDHLYASDMGRAHQTAEAVHALRPDVPFTVLSDLRELSIVDQPDYPARLTEAQREELHGKRVDRVVTHLRKNHAIGEVVLVVAHGAINKRLLAAMAGPPSDEQIDPYNAALTVATVGADDRLTVRLTNCTRHLLPSQLTMNSRG